LDVDSGEGGREYACSTGRGRRGGPRPAEIEGVQQFDFRGYALVRTAAGNAPALAVDVFWKSVSWARAISIAWAIT
jgi:hypothetical protein